MAIRVSASSVGDQGAPKWREPSGPVWWEACTIERWRGYRSSSFFACLEDGTPVAESGSFKVRGSEPDAGDGPARRAYDELVAALEELGWQRSDDDASGVWYATRFVRAVEMPEALPAAADPQGPEDVQRQPIEIWREPVVPIPPPPVIATPPRAVAPPPFIATPPPVVAPPPSFAAPSPPEPAEPPPAPVEPRQADPPEAPPRHRRRLHLATWVGGAGVVVAVGIVVLGTIGYGKPPLPTLQKLVKDTGVTQTQAASPVASTIPPAKSTPKPTSSATQTTLPAKAAARPAKPKVHKPAPAKKASAKKASAKKAAVPAVRLSLRAKRTGSWLEVRKQSASGPVVFSGVLTAGRALNLTGAGFWVRFGAASNVTVVVNGHPVALNGTIDRVFAAPRG